MFKVCIFTMNHGKLSYERCFRALCLKGNLYILSINQSALMDHVQLISACYHATFLFQNLLTKLKESGCSKIIKVSIQREFSKLNFLSRAGNPISHSVGPSVCWSNGQSVGRSVGWWVGCWCLGARNLWQLALFDLQEIQRSFDRSPHVYLWQVNLHICWFWK